MDDKIKSVMARVFGVKENSVNEDSSQDNIKKWDSLGHMNFIIALEQEFGVEFDDDQIIYMINYKLVRKVLFEICKNAG